MLLVFAHLLAVSMALGAIVATDLRLLSKLAQDRTRIAPPNEFVARIVMVALLVLYATGGALVGNGLLERADYLANPKLQAKLVLVVLLTINALVLHRLTFPRLARGRRVARWHASDWLIVGVPVAVSNFLWMFVAFLGIARAWNGTMPFGDIMAIAAVLLWHCAGRGVRDPCRRCQRRRSEHASAFRPRPALARLARQPRPAGGRRRRVRRSRSPAARLRDRDRAATAAAPRSRGAGAERRAQQRAAGGP